MIIYLRTAVGFMASISMYNVVLY